ncbi:phospholipase D-like domain-containing protein [Helicobacter sp. CaF467b]|uniref:phospholipase D-like domain-containing protein n=1 Tax=Helicobacter sp. CaF467b TaxID=2919923 RepID=UPI001F5AF7F7|nr:phospholipase D-like domain-containing protein [Helicobacter sp. CaF467b]MCI2236608.1 phospholipase D-like domain-containing protein [Helicobacter sp. CaF467b]
MFNKLFCIFYFCFMLSLPAFAQSLYFMPQEQNQAIKQLINTIKSAQNTLDIAIYSFTNREISKAIRDTAKKGVQVRIIYDKKSNQKNNHSTIGYLAKLKNIQTCFLEGKRSQNGKYNGLMHSKMAIIDDKHLILGSANWSKSAFEANYETLAILKNKEFIQKAQKEFEAMFKECEKY